MSELRQTMKDMGMELSDEEVELMMHRADTNGDGRIDYKGEGGETWKACEMF